MNQIIVRQNTAAEGGGHTAYIEGIACAGCDETEPAAIRALASVLGDFVKGHARRIGELEDELALRRAAMRSVTTAGVGLGGLLSELLQQPAAEVPDDVASLFEECCKAGDNFDLALRAPIDRLQEYRALTGSGRYNGVLYAMTTDVYLAKHDRVDMVRKVLAGVLDLLRRHDSVQGLRLGCDPVPVVFVGSEVP